MWDKKSMFTMVFTIRRPMKYGPGAAFVDGGTLQKRNSENGSDFMAYLTAARYDLWWAHLSFAVWVRQKGGERVVRQRECAISRHLLWVGGGLPTCVIANGNKRNNKGFNDVEMRFNVTVFRTALMPILLQLKHLSWIRLNNSHCYQQIWTSLHH